MHIDGSCAESCFTISQIEAPESYEAFVKALGLDVDELVQKGFVPEA